MTTPPLDRFLTMARMSGGIDIDHPPAPSGLSEDPRSHCADDSELVDPAAKRREDKRLHALTVPGTAFLVAVFLRRRWDGPGARP